jgi:hypothetical protein
MVPDFAAVFESLKPVLAGCAGQFTVKTDSPTEYSLDTKSPSPFPQHKGRPLCFAMIRTGKAYVSLHLLPLYMCPKLMRTISPELAKRMQGKACFNFKTAPEERLLLELKQVVRTGLEEWSAKGWL